MSANWDKAAFVSSATLVLVFLSPVISSLDLDYSIPALRKCDFNKLPDLQKSILVPGHKMTSGDSFTFRLTGKCPTRLPHCMRPCPSPMTQLQISFIELPATSTHPTDNPDYYQVLEPYSFTEKAYLRVENEYFSPDDYCVYSETDSGVVLKLCPSKCSEEEHHVITDKESYDPFEICVPKCCSIHKVLDISTDACEFTRSGVPWAPLVYRSASRQICGEKRANLKLHYVQTAPNCDSFNKYFLKSVEGSTRVRFRLLTNGTVVLRELGAALWTTLEPGTYCLDGIMGEGNEYSTDPTDQVLLVCDHVHFANHSEIDTLGNGSGAVKAVATSESRLDASGIAYVILLFSGIPFLVVTVIVYVLVWRQQNVHGWTLLSHTLAVLLHYLAQAVANMVSRIFTSEQNASTICTIVGVLNHLFVLASFFWLTVINYDLFSMFRHLKTTVGKSRGLKRFTVYSAIAWGIPLLVVSLSVLLDILYGLYGDDGDCEVDVVVPLYGHKSCYMVKDARPYYLYYPVGALMIMNLVLALMTFANMYRHDRESRNAHDEFSKRNTKHRKKFSVVAKLFVVMGLVWIFEFFVWSFIKENEVLPWYLVFPDVLNVLQAIAIFLLFACQPKILNQVEEKYPRLTALTELLKKLSCGKTLGKKSTIGSSSAAASCRGGTIRTTR